VLFGGSQGSDQGQQRRPSALRKINAR